MGKNIHAVVDVKGQVNGVHVLRTLRHPRVSAAKKDATVRDLTGDIIDRSNHNICAID
jgi:hypothetical protein